MERGTSGKKDMYERIINTHLNVLSDEEMAVFLALHEEGGIEGAALVLDMPADEVVEVIERYIPKKKERVNNLGEPYKRRLSQEAFRLILATHEDLDDEEREIISAMIGQPNQTMAARALGMSYKDYLKKFSAIRRKHGF